MGGRLGKTDTNKLGRGCEPCSLVRSFVEWTRSRGKTCSCANGKFVCVTRIVSGTIIIQHLPPSRPSYFLTRQTIRRSFILFFSSSSSSFPSIIDLFFAAFYTLTLSNLSNDYEPTQERRFNPRKRRGFGFFRIRERIVEEEGRRARDDPISVVEE